MFGLGLVLLAVAGCVGPQARLQMAEDAEVKKDLSVKTIADVADFHAVGHVQISGIGLVTGLDGTGSTPPGPYRKELEQILGKQKVEHIKELLDSPNCALVLVTAFIPPGGRRGDKLDVAVTLPPGSKASSLAGGYLQPCLLREHNSTKGLMPDYEGPDRLLPGHVMGRARGPLVAGLSESPDPGELRRARVWQGCISLIDMPYYLALKKDDKSYRVANAVAERLNVLFQEDPQRLAKLTLQQKQLYLLENVTDQLNHKFEPGSDRGRVAKACSKEMVQVSVPYAYRLDPERYLYVARLVPLAEEPEQLARYRRRLQKLLADPAETVMAARRLEALGRESVAVLKDGLAHEHPLVRFASAEALAYLGESRGVDELAKLAARHPLLTTACLTALTSLDEGGCRQHLAEMLAGDDVELRTEAFAALRQLAERDPPEPGMKTPWGDPYREWLNKHLGGEFLAGSFWLHRVAPQSPRLVSFSADNRAEVVLFGDGAALSAPIRTLVGREFALTLEPGSDRCVVSRITARSGQRQKLCTPALEDILRAMADLGCDYPDVVDLLRKLDERHCLNSPLRLNTAPPEVTVQMLAECGRNGTLLHDTPADAERQMLQTLPAAGAAPTP
jgi:hypothetical protein